MRSCILHQCPGESAPSTRSETEGWSRAFSFLLSPTPSSADRPEMTVHELRIDGKHGAAIGLANAIATRLAAKDTVEFAALKPPHPLHDHCTVVVRATDATAASRSVCEDLCADMHALLSALPEEEDEGHEEATESEVRRALAIGIAPCAQPVFDARA